MNKIIIGSMIAAVAALTGCEVTVVEQKTSCDMKSSFLGMTMHQCVESTNDESIRSYCNDEAADGASASVGSGCASGAKKSCKASQDGDSYTFYLYDDISAGAISCDDLRDAM